MLTYLESLDLSSNLFTGRIPVQLADLTFLTVLNLSHNQLEGPIPSGKHFNTFNASSFEGNLGLCGFPMPKECNNDEAPPLQPSNFHDGDDSKFFGEGFGWKPVALGYGCGFVFGVTMGYVVLRTRKPAWFLKVVEDQWNLKARRTKKNARRNDPLGRLISKLLHCQPPSHALDLVPLPKLPGMSIAAEHMVDWIKAIQEEERMNLEESNARYKAAADHKQRAKVFQVENLVMVYLRKG
uniref:Receptor-like protein 12 n=2 Tax=Populus alba TaxID=43335 RepID=A0A4U5P2Q0_POPAL|nr:hypothetical protein D5086_0000237970 [Populus alba]